MHFDSYRTHWTSNIEHSRILNFWIVIFLLSHRNFVIYWFLAHRTCAMYVCETVLNVVISMVRNWIVNIENWKHFCICWTSPFQHSFWAMVVVCHWIFNSISNCFLFRLSFSSVLDVVFHLHRWWVHRFLLPALIFIICSFFPPLPFNFPFVFQTIFIFI